MTRVEISSLQLNNFQSKSALHSKWVNALFPTLFDLLPKIAPRHWAIITLPTKSHTNNNIFHRNAHLFQLHTQLKGTNYKL